MRFKKQGVILGLFLLVLIVFTLLSTRINFHDAPEYISAAKLFAGIGNSNAHLSHSFLYSWVASFLLNILPSIYTLKLFNVIWLFLIGVVLWRYTKNIRSLLIWVFSPIVWFMSIYFSPILAASFFLLVSYIYFKKYERDNKWKYLLVTGICSGLSVALWTGTLVLVGFMGLIWLWSVKLWRILIFLLFFGIGLGTEFLLEYYYLGFPIYSMFIMLVGTFAIKFLGWNPNIKGYEFESIYIPFIIAPLTFFLYKLRFKENGKEILYLICSLFLLLIYGLLSYFLLVAPVVIILLGRILKRKGMIVNVVLSLVLIVLLTHSYFGVNQDTVLISDLEKVQEEFGYEDYIVGDESNGGFPLQLADSIWWEEKPFFMWRTHYEKSLAGDDVSTAYSYSVEPRLNIARTMVLEGKFFINPEPFDNSPILQYTVEGVPEGYKLVKSYEILSLYERE